VHIFLLEELTRYGANYGRHTIHNFVVLVLRVQQLEERRNNLFFDEFTGEGFEDVLERFQGLYFYKRFLVVYQFAKLWDVCVFHA
jgi:hypothetical protein